LLQGACLGSLKELFGTYVRQNKSDFDPIKNQLIAAAQAKLTRSSYSAISQCLSVVVLERGFDNKSVSEIIKLVGAKNEAQCIVSLLTIGELGKSGQDLSLIDSGLETKIFKCMVSIDSESVKYSASYALGNIAIGNMKKYVPSLMEMINNNSDRQYLLLNSLKEIITYYSVSAQKSKELLPFTDNITPLLLSNSSSTDEGVRSMIAECLGKFAVIDNKTVFGEIEKLLDCADVNTRETMCQSIKYCLVNIPQSLVGKFINVCLLKEAELNVKRQIFLSINNIFRIRIRLIINSLDKILPIIYNGTVTDESLIREVDLGPFKHRVDDGLPLRKAAFLCLDSLLDSIATPHKYDLYEFIKYLKNGLTDESPDIQMLTYQILYKIAKFYGSSIVGCLDTLPSDLMKGIKQKMNQAKGNKDAERAKDILRAACKALYTLRCVNNINKASKFVSFYKRVEKTKILVPILAELKNKASKIQ